MGTIGRRAEERRLAADRIHVAVEPSQRRQIRAAMRRAGLAKDFFGKGGRPRVKS